MQFKTFIFSFIIVRLFLLAIPSVSFSQYHPKIHLGIDCLLQNPPDIIRGKRLGLITNSTGLTSNLVSNIDTLFQDSRFQLAALFAPEHGVRGDWKAGQKISHYKDEATGLPVYSLYGSHHKPTQEMLENIDVLIFDIQDIGVRPYTYIYTMAYSMEAAKKQNIPFVVLDRPDPLGGYLVEGPVLNPEFQSFIGLFPIPYIHGMTVGELAQLFNEEFEIHCDLTVINMTGWRRSMLFKDTGLIWVPTSPHVPDAVTPFYMASTGGLGELGTVSEGVGTPLPFRLCGAPWVDGKLLADSLNNVHLPGVFFRPVFFKPFYRHFVDEECSGVQIHIMDYRKYRPFRVQLTLLIWLWDLFPEHNYFSASNRIQSFDRAMGTDRIRILIQNGKSATEIERSFDDELQAFKSLRQKYLLPAYNDVFYFYFDF